MARQSKSGTKKKKRNPSRRPQSDAPIASSSGLMGSMASGLKKAVGVGRGDRKKGSLAGNILWLIVLAAAAGFLFYRYSQ